MCDRNQRSLFGCEHDSQRLVGVENPGAVPSQTGQGVVKDIVTLPDAAPVQQRYQLGIKRNRRSRNVPTELRAEKAEGRGPRWRRWSRSRVTSHSSAPTHSPMFAWPCDSACRPQ